MRWDDSIISPRIIAQSGVVESKWFDWCETAVNQESIAFLIGRRRRALSGCMNNRYALLISRKCVANLRNTAEVNTCELFLFLIATK